VKLNPSKLLTALGFAACLAAASSAQAVPFIGTPASAAGEPTPRFGYLVDFDDQATGTAVGAGDYASLGVTISLLGAPNCTLTRFAGSQSAPNYIGTGSGCETGGIGLGWDGTVEFAFAAGVQMVGIGIADSQGPDVIRVFDADHNLLETFIAPLGSNVYAGISRASTDVFFLQVQMDFAALDDLQFVPEPSSLLLMSLGLLGLFGGWRRSRSA